MAIGLEQTLLLAKALRAFGITIYHLTKMEKLLKVVILVTQLVW